MKNTAKKIVIYSMVGLMQFGLGATIIEASPLYAEEGSQRMVQLDRGYGHDGDWHRDRGEQRRHREHEERRHRENERHEREMRRHHRESDRDWNDRQWRENQRHDNTMNEIAAGIIGIVIGSAIS